MQQSQVVFDLMDLWGVVLKELTMDSISNCTKSEDDDFFFGGGHMVMILSLKVVMLDELVP